MSLILLTGCSALSTLGAIGNLAGGPPTVGLDAQIGKTNERNTALVNVSNRPAARPTTISSPGSVTIQEDPRIFWAFILSVIFGVIGWLLPTPSQILKSLFNKSKRNP